MRLTSKCGPVALVFGMCNTRVPRQIMFLSGIFTVHTWEPEIMFLYPKEVVEP